MSVWPKPLSFARGSDVVWLSPNLTYTWEHVEQDGDELDQIFSDLPVIDTSCHPVKAEEVVAESAHGSAFLDRSFQRARETLSNRKFVPWKMHPRGSHFEPEAFGPSILDRIQFKEYPSPPGRKSISPEAYRLCIDNMGTCIVHVTHVSGAINALSTFVQLFYGHSKDAMTAYCNAAPLDIRDQPRFAHRGLNLDISRNVIRPKDVIRTLDGMWMTKLNRLHIHATDSQSWPLHIPAMPELSEKGAYHESQIWHPEDLEAVQEHGKYLNIEVYLEIDLPGHTGSVFHAYPDLTLAYDKMPWDKWAVEPPAGQLKLNSSAVHDFLRKLFDDLCPRISPFTRYFHIGGDELNTNCYTLEDGIKSSDKAVLRPFLERFFEVIFSSLKKHGMRPVLWEDILLDYDLTFPGDSIFQVWRSHDSLAKILSRGYHAIVGPADFWYLDLGAGTFIDPDPSNPDTPVKFPYPDWNPPFKNWRLMYSYDPFAGVAEEHHGKILGGEASLWCELTDYVNLDAMLWPRLGAAAEVLWTGPGKVSEEVTRRLAEFRERLVLEDIAAQVVQMEWSLRHKGRGVV